MTDTVAGGRLQARLHSHMWVLGVLGVFAGAALLIFAPRLKAVSASVLLFAGFHLVGGIVLLASLYVVALRRIARRFASAQGTARSAERYDFGWGPGWMNGLWIAALIALATAVALIVSAPAWWPLAFILVLMTASFFAGNLMMGALRRRDHVILPMVAVLSGDDDLVLDAGCGAGRTSVALARVLKNGRIVAFDRFDADYIDDGGRALLERNLRLAGLTERARVETGDLTAMPFAEASFDSAVSTHVYDHLGEGKQKALNETCRVLKPGGRFLMAVWVPGWTMFAIANVLSFFLTTRAAWREMARKAGFELVDEGVFNGAWFALLQKPVVAKGGPATP